MTMCSVCIIIPDEILHVILYATGLITMNTDWPATDYGQELIKADYKLAVPLTLLYLTPPAVAFIGRNSLAVKWE